MRLLPLILAFCLAAAGAAGAAPDRATFLDLARKGWVYELRSAIWGRNPETLTMRINGHVLSGAALCVVGEPPHPQTAAVLTAFTDLMAEVFGKPLPTRYAGTDLSACGTGRTVYLRLYSGPVPLADFNRDMRRLDRVYGLGMPRDRMQYVLSPAQAATFFGRRGQTTHLIVKQPEPGVAPTPLASRFYSSILVEELYQAFSFGMDILHFDRRHAFASKLQEFPVDLRHVPWNSPAFMEGLLRSNPSGLCRFDLFMLHALAEAPMENTNTPELLEFIDSRFDDLVARADRTAARAAFAPILDAGCAALD